MDENKGVRRELRGPAADVASVKLAAAVRRYLDDRKFDPHPVRQPAGTRIGEQFAPKTGATRGVWRAAAAQAGRAAIADPQALAAARPGALAVTAGGVAISRQEGLYAHYMDGQAITPILHLPGGKLETGPPPLTSGPEEGIARRAMIGRFFQECEEQEAKDLAYCLRLAKPAGGYSTPLGRKIYAICQGIASDRKAECFGGGVGPITTPRYHLRDY